MRWKLKETLYPVEEYNINPLLAHLLSVRGVTPSMVDMYLRPGLGSLYDPFSFNQMERAIDRLIRAKKQREKILIHGDFDVDGVTSLALIYRTLLRLGFNVIAYIPNRFDEGYGLSTIGIEKAAGVGATLLITVDCGITAVEEIEYANSLKIDVIITDHHEPKETLPDAFAIVNPKMGDYPYDNLAGVGVAFKLLEALYERLRIDKTELYWDLDLVALGTISDLVPLIDENRIITKAGISILSNSKKAGIKALKSVAGINRDISTYHVSFIMAPRLNAAGRMEDAMKAFKLLVTTEGVVARQMAFELNNLNLKRQKIEKKMVDEALVMVKGMKDRFVYVLFNDSWHEGVVGIVASRVVDRFYRPAILLTKKDDLLKGSARSIHGFNIFEAIASQAGYLETFGGHKYAAGLSLKPENLEKFREGINSYAKSVLTDKDLEREVEIDIDITDIYEKQGLFESYDVLKPFGIGNPKPRFLYRGARVLGNIRVLRENFYKFRIEIGKDIYMTVYSGNKSDAISQTGNILDIVFTLKEDKFLSKKILEIIDLKLSS